MVCSTCLRYAVNSLRLVWGLEDAVLAAGFEVGLSDSVGEVHKVLP